MADMVAEEKKTKRTTDNVTLRTSLESKKKWQERIAQLGWNNGDIVDNLLLLLDKNESPSMDSEYQSLYQAFVLNSERGVEMFRGMVALAQESVTKAVDKSKDTLDSKDKLIIELQKDIDEAAQEKAVLEKAFDVKREECEAREKEVNDLRIQLATMTSALNKITNIQQELDDTKERLADAEQKVATQK